jgi:hypothetical protein
MLWRRLQAEERLQVKELAAVAKADAHGDELAADVEVALRETQALPSV